MDFIIGKEEEFYNFLDKLSKKDKVGIITHDDLDGMVSALLVENILKSTESELSGIKFIGYEQGMLIKPIKYFKSKKVNKIILTDMNVDNSDPENFNKIKSNLDIFLIDHHPINPDFKYTKNILKSKSEDCSAWVLYNLAKDYIDIKKFEKLVCATMIAEYSFSDSENMKFLESKYPEIKKDMNNSKITKLTYSFGNANIFFKKNISKLYSLIKKDKLEEIEKASKVMQKELDYYVDKYLKTKETSSDENIYFAYFNPKFNLSSSLSTILSKKERNKVYLFATDSSKKNLIKISARNQSGDFDVNLLLKELTNGFENSIAGGHKKAAGASIMKKDLNKFKERVLNYPN